MKINCLGCGHTIDLDETYDDYAGQIRCYVYQATLEIKEDDGKLKSVILVSAAPPSS